MGLGRVNADRVVAGAKDNDCHQGRYTTRSMQMHLTSAGLSSQILHVGNHNTYHGAAVLEKPRQALRWLLRLEWSAAVTTSHCCGA